LILIRDLKGSGIVAFATLLFVLLISADASGDFVCKLRSDGVIQVVHRSNSDALVAPTRPAGRADATSARGTPSYSEILSLATSIAGQHGLDPALIKAVIKIESDFDPYAISSKGARGLMQLLPSTARLYDLKNYYDPAGNIDAGVRHLKKLLTKYDFKLDLALAAYNAGSRAVDSYSGVPPYEETVRFVAKVKRAYRRFGGRLRGTGATFSGRSGLSRNIRADGIIVIRSFGSRN